MSSSTLIRLGALAAILAGVLRTGCSFVPYSTHPSVGFELLYTLIDVLLLFGILGIYAHQHAKTGLLGFIGFVLAMTGTAVITGPNGMIGGVDAYIAGASVLSIGLSILSVGILVAGTLPRFVPVLWILSTVIGVGGHFAGGPPVTFMIAGLAFGLAFVGAGVGIWRDPKAG